MRGFISASSRNLVYLLFPIAILAAPASPPPEELVETAALNLRRFSATAAGTKYFGFALFRSFGALRKRLGGSGRRARSGRALSAARLNTAAIAARQGRQGYASPPPPSVRCGRFSGRAAPLRAACFRLPLYGSSGQYLGVVVKRGGLFAQPQWQRFTHVDHHVARHTLGEFLLRSDGVGEFVWMTSRFSGAGGAPAPPPWLSSAGIVTTAARALPARRAVRRL
jgi:hypothetical protein